MLNIDKNLRKGDGRSPIISSGAHGKALSRQGLIHRVLTDESGQILPWAVLLLLMFLGVSALVVDVGHAMLVQRQLQASTDAAALAAAQVLPSSTYTSVALKYSAEAGRRTLWRYFGRHADSDTAVPKKQYQAGEFRAHPPARMPCPCMSRRPSLDLRRVRWRAEFDGGSDVDRLKRRQAPAVQRGDCSGYDVFDADQDPNCGNKTQLACARMRSRSSSMAWPLPKIK